MRALSVTEINFRLINHKYHTFERYLVSKELLFTIHNPSFSRLTTANNIKYSIKDSSSSYYISYSLSYLLSMYNRKYYQSNSPNNITFKKELQ